ncbi:2-succinyl-5-enolpyruvyl-6-hydroxy-3-cyclohexene-1-carboxylate synthase [Aeromicrobium terrae]|uniref:2-succinyl-5-enolpyruvyl-6-hydroxy-3-cyclohexene-1-carboxylate synthase n=1 Tax=Aeromicrobium terrae TaxID=2498846 RepID=A0A5C8NGM1_9ACTN|nr:thiamine pyrophosphate-binding protein [Aeromicrobium terrae]TXL57965.1 2-succinyl-5-enolpyruvyl-6-hydroxy-3-cyclohexene-1-carboxylate synthase [Aeromicrobium terrae]
MSATETCRALVEDLLDLGVREAVLAPGSRSGPIALALAEADRAGALRLHVRVDERTAGFLALGLAKGSHAWVPVVTTSGTAVANLHPALLEARHSRVRVLALTADRPARLRGTGANQTTDQVRIFPGIAYGEEPAAVHALLAEADGPAHLNVELDEPLIEPGEWAPARRDDHPRTGPHVSFDGPPLEIAPHAVVVAGDDAGPQARLFAEQAGLPLLAEPTSGARNGENALVSYRPMLAATPLARQIDQVIMFGHPTLSRPITSLLGRTDLDVVVPAGDLRAFPHPPGHARLVHPHAEPDGRAPDSWLEAWRTADAMATAAVDVVTTERPDGAPYVVARAVSAAVPPNGLLVVGSSNPVRDLDLVARPYTVGERRFVIGNRGLAGIDGTISTAVGSALARQPSRAIAYLGDLTFLHDANGLLIGPDEPRPDLTVVVASDDGGSIFTTLEQGDPAFAASFERVYATPTGADLGALCAAVGVPHRRLDATELAAALEEPVAGIRVLEVRVPRGTRRELGAAINAAVEAAVQP